MRTPHAPVTNAATIRIVVTLMMMSNMTAEGVDVKGAFLKGDIEDGGEIHMNIPQGCEHHECIFVEWYPL